MVLDSLDKYWASEAKHSLPLNGVRVPIGDDTVADAKRTLADDLATQFHLLLMFHSSAHQLAEPLQENLRMLSALLEPRGLGCSERPTEDEGASQFPSTRPPTSSSASSMT